jgi:hypothetical protein
MVPAASLVYQLVEKLLRQPSASLRGARFLAYISDMSRSLRAVRLAAGRLATFFNKLLCSGPVAHTSYQCSCH